MTAGVHGVGKGCWESLKLGKSKLEEWSWKFRVKVGKVSEVGKIMMDLFLT